METISNILFWISNGLLIPVILLLLLFLGRSLILVGGFFGEFYKRTKFTQQLTDALEKMTSENAKQLLSTLPPVRNDLLFSCIHKLGIYSEDRAYCERLLANFEIDIDKELGDSRLFVKLGPMLGLMGTLIPMGPALVRLANGDISSMAYNMQVAFATTVVGMLIAAIGVVTLQVKKRWYARSINDLEFIYKKMQNEKE
ncbi:MAG: MotA/TolQ/ExbB proton channel family protein [Massilibacteroides sp.]|nr:MotA/TolQ/ExbB proton channel family protein [Massilibacteroides sp.]MDD3062507.1 MotA/TolQ/ExbB proton channel family protein [Massilibacteroides sp.]MDD4114442.1 MotA/TolQ/ExbB proton channel family protein [Massilibacteroides sp.]MDD4660347.1 MotA/TolQ/ExbB proton channel family protein [Massilibacteroides sp.]